MFTDDDLERIYLQLTRSARKDLLGSAVIIAVALGMIWLASLDLAASIATLIPNG